MIVNVNTSSEKHWWSRICLKHIWDLAALLALKKNNKITAEGLTVFLSGQSFIMNVLLAR